MQAVRGTVLHCGRYGCIVRLDDGRIANLPSSEAGHGSVRRALSGNRRPTFPFFVTEDEGWLRLQLATSAEEADEKPDRTPSADAVSASTPLDQKIIDYLKQTEDWDPNGTIAGRAQESKQTRADRLLPFEMRARRQYRDSPKKPPRKKR